MEEGKTTSNTEGIESVSENGSHEVAELRFDKLSDVLKYLQSQGGRISRATLYRHASEGKLLPEKGGTYKQRTVDRYAKAFLKLTIDGKSLSAKGKLGNEDLSALQTKRIMLENKLLENKAERERIKKEREEGLLVNAQDALDLTFTMCRDARDGILNIPDRISPILAAESNGDKVREILTRELRDALTNFSIGVFKEKLLIKAIVEDEPET
jgi:hypothetical protein